MGLYAISDLHLSYSVNKPMDVFGSQWENHDQKLKERWLKTIGAEDTVLLPGDLSWGKRLEEARLDLEWIQNLPGKKILVRGNHDYWWNSTSKVQAMFPTLFFLKNSYYDYQGIAICGTRGWICPNDTYFTKQDEKIYKREQTRLSLSLQAAVEKGYQCIYLMLHFPPVNDKREPSAFLEIIKKYPQIKKIIFGHLHNISPLDQSYQGIWNGWDYRLVSADYLDFWPKKLD